MRKSQLEAALRAAAEASGERELVLAGSQAIFGHTDDAPVEVLMSEECGVWSRARTEKWTVIEEGLGKNSPYHLAHGVYVDPVDPGIVLLPIGWEQRLKPMRIGDVAAWCLDVNDLVVSKLNAGRLKDYEFINAVLRAKLADWEVIVNRIEGFPDLHQRTVLLARLRISGERMP